MITDLDRKEHLKRLHERFAKEDARAIDEALRKILAMPEGRTVVRWIAETTGVYAMQTVENLEYQAGVRNAGLAIINRCNELAPNRMLESISERNAIMAERNEKIKEIADA